jgi:hypothetical protein
MNASAMGIGIGTFLFAWLGIWLQRDWFLMMGLLACCLGNVAFSAYLWEQGVAGERRDAPQNILQGDAACAATGVARPCHSGDAHHAGAV